LPFVHIRSYSCRNLCRNLDLQQWSCVYIVICILYGSNCSRRIPPKKSHIYIFKSPLFPPKIQKSRIGGKISYALP
jgi:hypothetical protein